MTPLEGIILGFGVTFPVGYYVHHLIDRRRQKTRGDLGTSRVSDPRRQ